MRQKTTFSYMPDCIHLHACRRVQAIGKAHRLLVPRYCSEDCDCYLSGDKDTGCISISKAIDYAIQGCSSIQSAYNEYDVYAPQDLQGLSLNEILDDLQEDE